VARFLRLHFTEKIHAMELIEYGEAASITEALPTASGAWEEAQRRRRGVGSSGRAILAGSPSLLAERRMDYLLGHSPIRIIPRFTKCRSSGAKSRRPKKPETSSSRESKSPT
jgi:hypothetical protein